MDIVFAITLFVSIILLLIVGYINLKVAVAILEILRNTEIITKSKEEIKKSTKIIPLKMKSQLQHDQEQRAKYFPDVASDPDKFFKNNNNANSIRNTN